MAKQQTKEINQDDVKDNKNMPPHICGIIMPIADIEGYPTGHWRNVHDIICEASNDAGFKANLVSSDDDVAVIQKRIVQNLYENPIVVCDISARNANVMFELGMRLAFDKPTVIIKDERTPYSFDISSIEHLEYPSDLRYQSINLFKERLASKIKETYLKSVTDPEYTTFLKHFGTFKVAQLDQKEVSETEYLASEIKDIKSLLISLRATATTKSRFFDSPKNYSQQEIDNSVDIIKNGVASYTIRSEGFSISKSALEKLRQRLHNAGFQVEQIVLTGKEVIIHLSSPLINEEENIFKDAI
ncbi:hypothetical protein, partial [Escherichia coli]